MRLTMKKSSLVAPSKNSRIALCLSYQITAIFVLYGTFPANFILVSGTIKRIKNQERVSSTFLVSIFTKASFWLEKSMGKECCFMIMVVFMRDNLSMETGMEKGSFMIVVKRVTTKGNGLAIKWKEWVIFSSREVFMKVILKKTSRMALGSKFLEMEINISGNIQKINFKEKASISGLMALPM